MGTITHMIADYIKVTGVQPSLKIGLKSEAALRGLTLSQHVIDLIEVGRRTRKMQAAMRRAIKAELKREPAERGRTGT